MSSELSIVKTKIQISLEFFFSVPCCIRDYNVYSCKEWNAEIGSISTSEPEVRLGALVEDKYAMAVLNNGQTIGHTYFKFLSQIIRIPTGFCQ